MIGKNPISLEKKRFAIAVSKQDRLNPGQQVLFKALSECYKKKEVFTLSHMQMIYKNNVQRSEFTWNHWKERIEDPITGQVTFKGGSEPKTDYNFKTLAMLWFTHSLGSLIKKGYLTVIPKINLQEPK